MPAQATAKNISISAKKLKWVAALVRGRRVDEALIVLHHQPTPAAREVAKVLKSAAANAENNLLLEPDELRVAQVYANQAPSLKRVRASARGRAGRISKRSSHITVVVDEEV